MSEQEAALFLPALVDKCGHSMDAVRGKFRIILRLIPGLFPASRLVGYLVRGLDSKNTKTRLEVLDVIESLLERHGADVVERGGNKALAEVAKLADARDMSMRTAALKCLVTAYKTSGAVVWKHVGRIRRSRAAVARGQIRARGEGDGREERRKTRGLDEGRRLSRGFDRGHARHGSQEDRVEVERHPWSAEHAALADRGDRFDVDAARARRRRGRERGAPGSSDAEA